MNTELTNALKIRCFNDKNYNLLIVQKTEAFFEGHRLFVIVCLQCLCNSISSNTRLAPYPLPDYCKESFSFLIAWPLSPENEISLLFFLTSQAHHLSFPECVDRRRWHVFICKNFVCVWASQRGSFGGAIMALLMDSGESTNREQLVNVLSKKLWAALQINGHFFVMRFVAAKS